MTHKAMVTSSKLADCWKQVIKNKQYAKRVVGQDTTPKQSATESNVVESSSNEEELNKKLKYLFIECSLYTLVEIDFYGA
jgi:hypothetical protein